MASSEHQYRQLLGRVNNLRDKYKILDELNGYNAFTVLFNHHDEVRLHSKYLGDLLNPDGAHRLGVRPLKLFLELLNIENFSLEEVEIEVLLEYENIDILIDNGTQVIIIENKLYAGDQPKQLERYYQAMINDNCKDEDLTVCYLSIDGKEPSSDSLGSLKLNRIQLVSYEFDILNWLNKLIPLSVERPRLRESLIQYRELLRELTQQDMSAEQTQELIKILAEQDNVLAANDLIESWNAVRIAAEVNYWSALEKLVEQNYDIAEHQKWSKERVEMANSTRRDPDKRYYGIMFSRGWFAGREIFLYIERGEEEQEYFGLTASIDGNRKGNNHPDLERLKEHISTLTDPGWEGDEFWLGGQFLSPRIQLQYYSDENTLKLINKDHAQELAKKHFNQIEKYLKEAKLDSIIEELTA